MSGNSRAFYNPLVNGSMELASLTVGGYSGLYEINLFTGRASHRGNFAVGVTDIAIPLDR